MGISKICIMPLLTTLAALIIIVHCIEEDLENEYRRDGRPKIMDIENPTYDESWRAGDATEIIPRPRRTDDWKEDLPNEPLKHRRPGRKRKRRPQTATIEEIVEPAETSYLDEPARPYHDVDSEINIETTERPKLRRRKPDQRQVHLVEEDITAVERPFRRRSGARRNRPSIQAVPEVNGFDQNTDITQDVEGEPQEKDRISFKNSVNTETSGNKPETNREKTAFADEDVNFEEISMPEITEDKSVSEFSMEVMKTLKPRFKFPRRYKPTSPSATEVPDKEQESKGPLTLKDILKRSNGSSLSEILQQHNLSLNDLLHEKEQAVSIFKNQNFAEDQRKTTLEPLNTIPGKEVDIKTDVTTESGKLLPSHSETKEPTDSVTEYLLTTEAAGTENENIMTTQEREKESTTTTNLAENSTRIRRRFPLSPRKKLRMRPTINVSTTQKGQLSRDLVALNARKYTYLKRYTTKSKEWKDIVPNTKQIDEEDINSNKTEHEITTQSIMPEDTTILRFENKSSHLEQSHLPCNTEKLSDIDMDTIETTTATTVTDITTEFSKFITTTPIGLVTMARPTAISLGLRQTALNNRLKRKRLKQKALTTESPQDDILKNLYGMANLVSSSEFIAKTQPPETTAEDIKTTTVDVMTTDSIKTTTEESVELETIPTTMTPISTLKTSTEESAKTEIEEILNDTETLSKLSRILMERNMTLEELVALRERGSSRIHLADVFHNSSKEPNPPEPFLTKSVLEPISKETYPLRALLDANSHDSTAKTTTIDPMLNKETNIPIVMDFGNNVNENAENMGIMSLFNNYTKNITLTKTTVIPDNEITNTNLIDIESTIASTIETTREGKVFNDVDVDIVNWNDVLSLMERLNETEAMPPDSPYKKIILEDIDDDGLIVLEDLQHLRDLDNHIHRGESPLNGNLEVKTYGELTSQHQGKGILDNAPSQISSVTIVTASIVGLAMILFLLTYIAFKWKQQRSSRKKHSFCEERISTPVFETRKGHKNNSSTRSISPMIQTSNIYAVNTLDSHLGEESGEYIWDSMRQPFQ